MNENEYKTSAPSPSPDGDNLYGAPRGRGKGRRTLGTWLWPAGIFVIVALGVWIIIANSHPSDKPSGGRRGGGDGSTPVAVVVATNGDLPIYIDALGTVTPTATVTVHTLVSGILQSVDFTEGQMVTKGQLLAQVDPRPYQAALMQAQGTLARDTAQLSAAKVDLTRYKTLLAQDSVSSQTVDQQTALVGQLEGTVQSDQAAVNTQKLNLSYAHIVAPINGRVGLRQVDAGNYVTPGDSNGLVAITEQSPIDVAFTLPEDNVQRVTTRFNSKEKLPVSVLDRDQTRELAKGQLFSLDNLIDTTTGTLRAKARFDNSGGALFPSQFVNVRLLVDTLRNVVIVPSSAILRGNDGLFVYVPDAYGAVHVRNVQTGPSDGEQTAILSGVSPGEKIVTDGTDRLRDGACVVIGGGTNDKSSRNGHNRDQAEAPKPGFFASLFGGKAVKGASEDAKGKGMGQGQAGKGCGGPSMGGRQATSGASGGHGGGNIKAMLAQLDLTADQQNKAGAILSDASDKTQATDDPDAKRAIRQAANSQIMALLTAPQQAKLKQLHAVAATTDATSGKQ